MPSPVLIETEVPLFMWQEYLGDPQSAISGHYPTVQTLRYPRAGRPNPQAVVNVYDIYLKTTHTMSIDTEDSYIPRLKWTQQINDPKNPVESKLIVQKVNRDQTKMEVYLVTPKSTASWLLYKEQSNEYYIDYTLFDSWYWLKDGRFIALSEKDGWNSIYLYSAQGQEMKRLTPDEIDVTRVYGVDEKNDLLYYQAAPTPLQRQCYAYDLKKNAVTELTTVEGIHAYRFAKDFQHAIGSFESYEMPPVYTLYEIKKGAFQPMRELLNNDTIMHLWQESGLPDKQFFTIHNERNDSLNAWMILPPNMEFGKKYPCVLMQYSGPNSQQVLNRWRKGFGHYLASQGYVVINSDGRGTACRGRAWRNETYMHLGQKEADDQISTARFAASLAFVDPERIAIMGWSYGGYQAIRTLCEKDNGLKCGVAIAGYTERFMRRPQVNETGYDKADLTKLVDRLDGKLLIIHGLADDNVHVQHTLLFTEALVQAGKQFEMQLYPDDNHFLRKRANYEHVHRRIMLFLQSNL